MDFFLKYSNRHSKENEDAEGIEFPHLVQGMGINFQRIYITAQFQNWSEGFLSCRTKNNLKMTEANAKFNCRRYDRS